MHRRSFLPFGLAGLLLAGTIATGCRQKDQGGDNCNGGCLTNIAEQLHAHPGAVVADRTQVYWLMKDDSGLSSVMKAPATGGSATTLASAMDSFVSIAVDRTSVYWSASGAGQILTVPITGGAVTTMAENQAAPAALAVNAVNLYWTNNTAQGSVVSVPVLGGTPKTLAAGQGLPACISIDNASVYWANQAEGVVLKVPIDGGSIETIASGQDHPVAITNDVLSLFWANGGNPADPSHRVGSIVSRKVLGGDPVTLYRGALPVDLVADSFAQYFILDQGGILGGEVDRVLRADTAVTAVAYNNQTPARIAVNPDAVFWTTENLNGSVVRLSPK